MFLAKSRKITPESVASACCHGNAAIPRKIGADHLSPAPVSGTTELFGLFENYSSREAINRHTGDHIWNRENILAEMASAKVHPLGKGTLN